MFFLLPASVGVVVQIFLDWQFNLFQARLLAKFYLSTQTANTLFLTCMSCYILCENVKKMTICPNFVLIPGNLKLQCHKI